MYQSEEGVAGVVQTIMKLMPTNCQQRLASFKESEVCKCENSKIVISA